MTDITQSDLEVAKDKRREALIERISMIADLCCENPLEGECGDVAYDLLRQAAAQIGSDRQAIAAQSAEIERLKAEIQRLDLNGVHTFSDTCDRLPCVQRREIEALKADLECSEKERVAIWNECRDLKSSRIVDFAALTAERARSKALVEAGKPLLFAVEAVDDFNRLNPPEDGRMRPVSLMILDSELRKLATALAQFEKEEK